MAGLSAAGVYNDRQAAAYKQKTKLHAATLCDGRSTRVVGHFQSAESLFSHRFCPLAYFERFSLESCCKFLSQGEERLSEKG